MFLRLVCLLAAAALVHPATVRFDLGGNDWTLTNATMGRTIAAEVPGQVHTDLLRAGVIGEPFNASNEQLQKWFKMGDHVKVTGGTRHVGETGVRFRIHPVLVRLDARRVERARERRLAVKLDLDAAVGQELVHEIPWPCVRWPEHDRWNTVYQISTRSFA